jgi:hypothetical protein
LLAALLLSGVAAGAVGMFGRLGDPVSAVRDAKRAFAAPAPQIGTDLNKRLFTLSGTGRAQLWRAAWDDARAHPWLGSGAGSFEGYWLAHRPTGLKVRDAHSLYLETLAELGPGGLALLVLALGLPLVAAVRARREPLVPIVAGAYVVYLVHAAADWDWELAGVTLPALACGAVLLVAVGGKPRRLGLRAGVLAAATSSVLLMAALAGLAGSNALAASAAAAREGRWGAAAAQAGLARRWAPWSAEPWRRLGEAELARGRRAVARHDFARALAKDPHDAATWLDLAGASNGRAARRALAHVRRLDPRSPDLADFRRQFRQTDPKGATR